MQCSVSRTGGPAVLLRPVVVDSDKGELAGLEIVGTQGDRYVFALSGEGRKEPIQEMQLFLEEHQHLAKIQSQPRQ